MNFSSKYIYFIFLILASIGVMNSSRLMYLSLTPLVIFSILNLIQEKWHRPSLSLVFLTTFVVVSIISILITPYGADQITLIKKIIFPMVICISLWFHSSIKLNDKDLKIIFVILAVFVLASTASGLVGIISNKMKVHLLTGAPVCHLDRNCGVFGSYMNYAHNLLLFFLLSVGLFLKSLRVKKVAIALFVLLLINLYFIYSTYTRGIWIGLMVALPFFAISRLSKKGVLIILSLFLLISIVGLLNENVKTVFTTRAGSNHDRVLMWKTAIETFKENKVLGIGMGNFEGHSLELKRKYSLDQTNFKGHVHNNFLEVLAGTGLIGFISFILWIIFWIKEVVVSEKKNGRLVIPFIVGFLVAGATQSTIVLAPNLFMVMMVYYLSQQYHGNKEKSA